jgi:uncharacterized glyoxalase superfamily protein PhnB
MPANFAKDTRSTIIPALRYRDARKAIDWLVLALGFKEQAVYEGANGTIEHAQLSFGNGMIMLGSASNTGGAANHYVQPDEAGGHETQAPYLVVADATAIYESAQAAGAVMLMELREMDYGGKAFTCRDPEGHIWAIGEYDPWATG